jgi:small-conductance mechanosensitive channel
VCGVYFVVMPILSRIPPGEELTLLQGVLVTSFNVSLFILLFWFLFRFTHVLEARIAAWASKTSSKLDDLLVPLLGRGLRVMLPVAAVMFALPILNLPSTYAGVIAQGTSVLLIVAVAILLFQAVKVGERAVLLKFDITAADNLRARQVYTQIHVISRVVYVIIGVFTVACILMLFQQVRHVGSSLLASAGIIGIVAGVAGQKSLANLFAGFQIALAQPIRQDDVVIVEGEWGRVEEITFSYVVVHIWDDRRLVLPLSYFIDKPFQNWTRASARLLGSILLWVDYSFPVDEGRKALKQIIEGSAHWDKRFWNLQVSDASERTMQLRVLATAVDSSKSWDLRCEIREKFIAYIQKHHPRSLPQLRTDIGLAAIR